MDSVIRAAAIYLFILVMIRISGKRTLSETTTFDFVLLLLIGEASQQALLGNDFSLTTALTVILTLVALDILVSFVKRGSATIEKWLDGLPLVILENGRLLHDRMKESRVDEGDILEAARKQQGIERLDQIKYAVLERSGGISIIPAESAERS
jgi:uncharacterized membrane protein YcaP (DUF421 family)